MKHNGKQFKDFYRIYRMEIPTPRKAVYMPILAQVFVKWVFYIPKLSTRSLSKQIYSIRTVFAIVYSAITSCNST